MLQIILNELSIITDKSLIIPTFQLSKDPTFDFKFSIFKLTKNFSEYAKTIIEHLKTSKIIINTKFDLPGYILLKIDPYIFSQNVLQLYMLPQLPKPQLSNIFIEFSSPNTNKPQHLGHVRNNHLGMSMSNILSYCGHNVKKIILVNDRGIHICKSMVAYMLLGNNKTPKNENIKPDHFVGKYYVEYERIFVIEYENWLITKIAKDEFDKWNQKFNNTKNINDFKNDFKDLYFNNFSELGFMTKDMLCKWENGDKEVMQLWKLMNDWVFEGFNKTYDNYGITFDIWEYESEIYNYGKQIIMKAYDNNQLENIDGAISCDLVKIGVLKPNTKNNKYKPLLRKDNTTMYMTQDIGTIINRYEKYNFDKLIYVVADEQNLHFQTLFKLTEYLKPETKDKFYHLSYGMVNLPDGKMKSRTGTVVDADDLLLKLKTLAFEITKDKWNELSDEECYYRSNIIALAAIKYYILSIGPTTTITFDPKASLDFNGKTGPYILYNYARTQSILKKSNMVIQYDIDVLIKLNTNEEMDLLKNIYWLDHNIDYAANSYDPSKITDSLYNIAKSFSQFHNSPNNHVLNCDNDDLKYARLMLVNVAGMAIKKGATLLGIELLDKM